MDSLRNFRMIGRKIICVGRNYRAHAVELGNVVPKKPLLFMKSTSCYIENGGTVRIPLGCTNLSQEVELGVVIDSKMLKVKCEDAMEHVGGYCVALDMTARDFQEEAKNAGSPWFLAKSFDTSCPVSELIPKTKVCDPHRLRLWCDINGKRKQNATTDEMIFDISTLLSYISQYVTLEPGDVVLTGTPSGVSKVEAGDVIECGIEGLQTLSVRVEN